jgi:hypothetical protein
MDLIDQTTGLIDQIPDPSTFSAQKSRLPRKPLKGSVDEWHNRLGHLNPKAVKNLPANTNGVKLTTTNLDPACEKCRISYSKKIISRRPIQRAETPFFRVHFDLIQMRYGLDDAYLIGHFLEDMFRMNYIYILQNKKQEIVLGTL